MARYLQILVALGSIASLAGCGSDADSRQSGSGKLAVTDASDDAGHTCTHEINDVCSSSYPATPMLVTCMGVTAIPTSEMTGKCAPSGGFLIGGAEACCEK